MLSAPRILESDGLPLQWWWESNRAAASVELGADEQLGSGLRELSDVPLSSLRCTSLSSCQLGTPNCPEYPEERVGPPQKGEGVCTGEYTCAANSSNVVGSRWLQTTVSSDLERSS